MQTGHEAGTHCMHHDGLTWLGSLNPRAVCLPASLLASPSACPLDDLSVSCLFPSNCLPVYLPVAVCLPLPAYSPGCSSVVCAFVCPSLLSFSTQRSFCPPFVSLRLPAVCLDIRNGWIEGVLGVHSFIPSFLGPAHPRALLRILLSSACLSAFALSMFIGNSMCSVFVRDGRCFEWLVVC